MRMDSKKNTADSARRKELIRIAANLFRKQGYERTTVRDLAHHAGIKSGSIFYHFRSKEEILWAVMALGITSTTEKLAQALSQSPTPRDKIAVLFRVHLHSLLGENRDALEVMLYEWRSVSEEIRPTLIELRDHYEALWQTTLDEAQASGDILPIDTKVLRRMLLGGLHWSAQWFRESGELSIDALADEMMKTILRNG